MKKLIITLTFLPVFALAQIEESTPKVELGNTSKEFFIKDGQGYKFKEYKEVFVNPTSLDHIKKARTNKTFGSILLYTGSFFVGFGVGYALSIKDHELYGKVVKRDRDRNTGWIIAGSGLGIALSSIPLWNGYSKNIKKAVEVENGETETSVSQLKLNVNGNGVGLAYQF